MWLLYLTLTVFFQFSSADSNSLINTQDNAVHINRRQKTTVISDEPEDCLFVASETGYFTYKSTSNNETICGIYLMTDPEYLVEITFTEFDVPCDSGKKVGSLVQYLDGWELNGEVFPSYASVSENSGKEAEFCSNNKPTDRTFVSSQNGALISYRIPQVEKGFTIFVNHKRNPSPCNIIHMDEPYYILKNHGNRVNCSIWSPNPIAFKFNSYSIGNTQSMESSSQMCSDSPNQIEIGGGGLDTNRIEVLDAICNKSNPDGEKEEMIFCSTATIKLVSDGNYENHLNISMRAISPNEMLNTNAKYQCHSSSVK